MATATLTPMTLNRVRTGDTVQIVSIHGDDAQTQRLLALGLVQGVTVSVVRVAPLGDPMTLSIAGNQVSVRRNLAKVLEVASVV